MWKKNIGKMINNQLVFANTLYYTPDKPKGLIRTAVPFALQVLCLYNRFYYSYKIGYLPEIKTQQFFMSMIPSGDFTLTTCNAEWQRLPESTGYIIGSPMYFEASLPSISWDQRLYVSFCYATRSRNIGNTLHYMVIGEYGCMADSAVPGSRARFVRHERNVLRFVVEAFVFEGVPEEHLYMHCEMFVADVVPTEMAKSCTYNSTAGRWEELYGDPQVCSCCDSTCVTNASAAALPATKKMVTSGSWMLESEGGVVPGEATVEWDEITPTETRTVTESMATTVTGPLTRKVTKPVTRRVTQPVTRRVTQPVTRRVTQPVTRRVTQPVTRMATQPVIRRVTQPVTRRVTQPVTRMVTQPVTRMVTQPVTRRATQPVTRRATQPVTRRATQPVTRRVTQPVTRMVTQPVTRMVTQPVTRRATQPVTRRATQPVTRRVTQPVT
ncbi:zona pellucida sperm-binding protein 3-like, partial [Conger conger]|uniref:zona pellucida sperm-binding protein 3-like n=1 Tax=Conger conger TaxID=82655 RepID=UPI002A59B7CC